MRAVLLFILCRGDNAKACPPNTRNVIELILIKQSNNDYEKINNHFVECHATHCMV